MSQLVDHLADLTGYRDRDVLDVTLVGAMKDLLRPESVAIYRAVGESGQERWLTRARLSASDLVATADPAWVDIEALPMLSQHPQRLQAMNSREITQVTSGKFHVTVFPVATDRDVVAVMEITSALPLSTDEQRLVGAGERRVAAAELRTGVRGRRGVVIVEPGETVAEAAERAIAAGEVEPGARVLVLPGDLPIDEWEQRVRSQPWATGAFPRRS